MWQDPDYCRWIVDTYNSAPDDCTEKLKIAAEWIQENNPEINEGRLMGFGKHRSETMEWVYENEPATQFATQSDFALFSLAKTISTVP